jgi:hypothetical protein
MTKPSTRAANSVRRNPSLGREKRGGYSSSRPASELKPPPRGVAPGVPKPTATSKPQDPAK